MIKNIIFDLGNVLVGVDFEKSKKSILSQGVSEKEYRDFFNKNVRRRFESGGFKTSAFMDLAYRALGKKITKVKLKELFQDMFFELPEMRNFVEKLSKSKKYKIFLFSNTNSLHFNYIRKKFAYINLVDKFILSYKLKMVKPDERIYRSVLKKYKLRPDETLFIDDLKDNCVSAGKFGIRTICYINYTSFLKQFRKIILT